MKLLVINGYKRSGKNTVGDLIAASRPGVHTLGFADKLKIAAMKTLGFQRSDAELVALADEFKETATLHVQYREPKRVENFYADMNLTGREMLQWFGTEAGRETFADEFWIDLVLPRPMHGVAARGDHGLGKRYPGVELLVITDGRFANEVMRVRDLGGKVVHVERPGAGGGAHASEKPLPWGMVDYVIENDGDMIDLEFKVEEMLEALKC